MVLRGVRKGCVAVRAPLGLCDSDVMGGCVV